MISNDIINNKTSFNTNVYHLHPSMPAPRRRSQSLTHLAHFLLGVDQLHLQLPSLRNCTPCLLIFLVIDVINLYIYISHVCLTQGHGLLQFVINTSERSLSTSISAYCKQSALHGARQTTVSLGRVLHTSDLSLRPSVPPTWPPASLFASTSMRQDYQG